MSFLETEYHQTGVGDIAKRTGVSLGNLYNYFCDKRCASFLAYVSTLTLETPSLPTKTIWHFLPTFFYSLGMLGLIVAASDLDWLPQMPFAKRDQTSSPKTTAINQLWQIDFTYLKIIGWGWFYLSTILDDYSRYIIAWKLCTNMRTQDVTDTLDLALEASGCDQVHVIHKPRLLSDNGSSYVSGELAEWLKDKSMKHSRGVPYHPQTQGKIVRWHQILKNRILLEHYFLSGDLEVKIKAFVDHYNHRRYPLTGS